MIETSASRLQLNMTSALNAAEFALSLIGTAASCVFILTMAIGVPAFLVYAAKTGPNSHRKVRRLNHRLFLFSLRIFYIAFFCILLSKLLEAVSGG
ncbi:hypothetical protein CEE69_28330 [Rhodopirellula bahusiensis]|uniref:Uncharacterized protein n=1 Tax=Rhodopirellula bahusiensis TaxID=2014065 RepID=A0A2G1VZD1_9BACT|nr:hypothetical protein CEE69_28330 [Rhodopirellula bahusiensis]